LIFLIGRKLLIENMTEETQEEENDMNIGDYEQEEKNEEIKHGVGVMVRLCNLKSEKYNGMQGQIQGYNEEKERYLVQCVLDNEKLLSLKAEKLEILEEQNNAKDIFNKKIINRTQKQLFKMYNNMNQADAQKKATQMLVLLVVGMVLIIGIQTGLFKWLYNDSFISPYLQQIGGPFFDYVLKPAYDNVVVPAYHKVVLPFYETIIQPLLVALKQLLDMFMEKVWAPFYESVIGPVLASIPPIIPNLKSFSRTIKDLVFGFFGQSGTSAGSDGVEEMGMHEDL